MIFEVYPVGVFAANCYLIGCEKTKEGFIVDPGGDCEGILNLCKTLGIEKIKYILLTHGHGDHIGAVSDLRKETGAKVLISEKDKYLIEGETVNIIPILRNIKLFSADDYLKDGDVIEISDIKVEVLETPGHTPGGLSFKINNFVLTGDALFKGSVGRTDFPLSSHEDIIRGIKSKIMVLKDETIIYPGHGPSTTVGYERKYNPFL